MSLEATSHIEAWSVSKAPKFFCGRCVLLLLFGVMTEWTLRCQYNEDSRSGIESYGFRHRAS